MDITRGELIYKDGIVWVVQMTGDEVRNDPDCHALADTLDKLRVRKGENGVGVHKG